MSFLISAFSHCILPHVFSAATKIYKYNKKPKKKEAEALEVLTIIGGSIVGTASEAVLSSHLSSNVKSSVYNNRSTDEDNSRNEDYDRTWRDEDGNIYYGYDDEEGYTDWYNRYGDLDSRTETPSDDEQAQNDEGY